MINLLPDEIKQGYRYAGRNSTLRRWILSAGIALIIVGLIGGYGWLSLRQATADSGKQISTLQASLDKAQLKQTNQRIVEIGGSFKLVQKVLSQEILFSQLLKQMATALPNGTYLANLNIPQVTSGSALDVTVNAASYTAATQVQLNLADPANQIFAKADIQNISCDSSSAADPDYPCTITLRAQFAQNNPFLFINQQKAKS